MPIKEREPFKILLAITTSADGKVSVSTDLSHHAKTMPLCNGDRLAVEFLSIAAYCGYAVLPMPDAGPSAQVSA